MESEMVFFDKVIERRRIVRRVGQVRRVKWSVAIVAAFMVTVCVAVPPTATVTVDPAQELRAVKPMNGVNNGRSGSRGIAGAR